MVVIRSQVQIHSDITPGFHISPHLIENQAEQTLRFSAVTILLFKAIGACARPNAEIDLCGPRAPRPVRSLLPPPMGSLAVEFYRIFGFDPATDRPSRLAALERVHPDDRARIDRTLQEAIRTKASLDISNRVVLPDGTMKHVHMVGYPVLDQGGEVVEMVGTSMDVTEQYQNRAAMERAFEEIRDLKDQLYRENLALRDEVDRASMFEEIVGTSTALQAVLSRIAQSCSDRLHSSSPARLGRARNSSLAPFTKGPRGPDAPSSA